MVQRIDAVIALKAENKLFNQRMRSSEKQAQRFGRELEKTQRRLKRFESASTRTSRALRSLRNSTAGLVVGFLAVDRAARAFVSTLDVIQQLENRLRLVTDSNEELLSVQRSLTDIARQTGTSIRANTEQFTRMALSIERSVISLDDLIRLQRVLSANEAITGITGPSVQAARIQLIQGLAAGELRGQELRSVLEQDPATALLIARGLGIPVGDLLQVGAAGGLTSQTVSSAVLSQEERTLASLGDIDITIGRAFESLQTELFETTKRFNEITDIGNDLANALVDLANIIQNINLSPLGRAYNFAGRQLDYLGLAAEFLGTGGVAGVGAVAGSSVFARNLSIIRREEQLEQLLAALNKEADDSPIARELGAANRQRVERELRTLRANPGYESSQSLRTNYGRIVGFIRANAVATTALGGIERLLSIADEEGYGRFLATGRIQELSDEDLSSEINRLGNLIGQLTIAEGDFAQRQIGFGEEFGDEVAEGIENAFGGSLIGNRREFESALGQLISEQIRREQEGSRITRTRTETELPDIDDSQRLRLNRQLFEVLDRLARAQPSVSSPTINRAAGIQAVRDLQEQRRLQGAAGLRQGVGSLLLTNPPVNEPLIQSLDQLTERLRELGTVFEDVNPDVARHADEVRQLGQNIAETLVQGIRDGASAVEIFGDIATQVLNRIIQQAITDPLAESIGNFLGSAIFGSVQGLGPAPAHSGGNVARGGFVRVGDAGPELVALPQGAYIHPRGNLMDGQGTHLTINVNGVQDPTIVRRQVEQMYPEIARIATGATVQAARRPSPLRRALN